MNHMRAFLVSILVFYAIQTAECHGIMTKPRQRGSLTSRSTLIFTEIDGDAPRDYKPHFPAGDKSTKEGAGKKSQIREGRQWTPFNPEQPDFRWRAGVCGDLKGGTEAHRKGGEYYYDGKVVESYSQGGIIDVELSIVTHHNGYIEMHVCDVSKCKDGEIGEECFRNGACHALQRAENPSCDRGQNRFCGPIDRNYPTRWYLPCRDAVPKTDNVRFYGPSIIQYQLPSELSCEHCVLHWYWVTANVCNPPGTAEYFSGLDRPLQWERSKCPGQGDAIGGANIKREVCGGDVFPEEFMQCADIQIDESNVENIPDDPFLTPSPDPDGGIIPETPPPTPSPFIPTEQFPSPSASPLPSTVPPSTGNPNPYAPYDVERGMNRGLGRIRDIVLVGDGQRIVSLLSTEVVFIDSFSHISIEAITEKDVRYVSFHVNGRLFNREVGAPFFINGNFGNGTALSWTNFVPNEWTRIRLSSGRDRETVRVMFVK